MPPLARDVCGAFSLADPDNPSILFQFNPLENSPEKVVYNSERRVRHESSISSFIDSNQLCFFPVENRSQSGTPCHSGQSPLSGLGEAAVYPPRYGHSRRGQRVHCRVHRFFSIHPCWLPPLPSLILCHSRCFSSSICPCLFFMLISIYFVLQNTSVMAVTSFTLFCLGAVFALFSSSPLFSFASGREDACCKVFLYICFCLP